MHLLALLLDRLEICQGPFRRHSRPPPCFRLLLGPWPQPLLMLLGWGPDGPLTAIRYDTGLGGEGPQTGDERDGAGTSPQPSLAGLASPCP